MKIKILIGVLVFLILVNLATIGSFIVMLTRGNTARPFWHTIPGRHIETSFGTERPMRRMSPELRNRLRNDVHELHADTRGLRAEIHDLEAETFSLMQMDPVPVEHVDSLLQQIAEARLEISRIATRHMIEARSNLTPEERQMFFDALLGSRPEIPSPPHIGVERDGRRHQRHSNRNREHRSDSLRK